MAHPQTGEATSKTADVEEAAAQGDEASEEESSDEESDEEEDEEEEKAEKSEVASEESSEDESEQASDDASEEAPEETPQKPIGANTYHAMSETAIWRAGVLGHERPEEPVPFALSPESASPEKGANANAVAAGRPPYAPPFEVAKLPVAMPSTNPASVEPASGSRGSGRGSAQGSAVSSGRKQCHRAASEGRLAQPNVDPRAAVCRTHLDATGLALQCLERHPDSLLARARAPAPLPRYVAPPQGPSQLKYCPPARDSWEYEKVSFPKDVVQVVRLESKPFVRKSSKETQDDVTSRRRHSKMSNLNNIYGALLQDREPPRQPARVQSLPALHSLSRTPPLARMEAQSVFHVSPQRLMAIS